MYKTKKQHIFFVSYVFYLNVKESVKFQESAKFKSSPFCCKGHAQISQLMKMYPQIKIQILRSE